MFSLFRYKKNGLPYGIIAIHEFLVQDIFRYFETGRLVKKNVRRARKSIKAALRFARRKKTYPSTKTVEILYALEQIDDELEYTQKAIQTAFEEAQNVIKKIRQEKVGEIILLVENAKQKFIGRDLQGGTKLLKEAQEKMKNKFLLESRKTALTGIDSDIKKLKGELLERKKNQSNKTQKPT
jgi:hypothetical protein